MKRTYRYDEKADMFYEVGDNYFEERKQSGPNVISDNIGGVNGVRHMPSGKHLDSKRAHYHENKRRGLEEVGNQTDFATKRKPDSTRVYEETVHTARQQIAGNHNGVNDWLRWRERQ